MSTLIFVTDAEAFVTSTTYLAELSLLKKTKLLPGALFAARDLCCWTASVYFTDEFESLLRGAIPLVAF